MELIRAIQKGGVNLEDQVRSLIAKDHACVNFQTTFGNCALHIACAEEKYKEVVEILLNERADTSLTNRFGLSPLHISASEGCLHIVELLLEAKANVDAMTNVHNTPLHKAAGYGCVETMQLLVDQKANVEARNDDSRTPLHFAVTSKKQDAVEWLLNLMDTKAIDVQDKEGDTALNLALALGNKTMASFFLDKKCDVQVANKHGLTPLHYAAKQRFKGDFIQLLLESGADINARDENNHLPIDVAESQEVEAVLRREMQNAGCFEDILVKSAAKRTKLSDS